MSPCKSVMLLGHLNSSLRSIEDLMPLGMTVGSMLCIITCTSWVLSDLVFHEVEGCTQGNLFQAQTTSHPCFSVSRSNFNRTCHLHSSPLHWLKLNAKPIESYAPKIQSHGSNASKTSTMSADLVSLLLSQDLQAINLNHYVAWNQATHNLSFLASHHPSPRIDNLPISRFLHREMIIVAFVYCKWKYSIIWMGQSENLWNSH